LLESLSVEENGKRKRGGATKHNEKDSNVSKTGRLRRGGLIHVPNATKKEQGDQQGPFENRKRHQGRGRQVNCADPKS